MLHVGLTGGIGAGKSAVARRLAAHGAVLIDADAIARDVLAAGTPASHAVAEAFGPVVVDADGSLDRKRLADLVFADAERRQTLNEIVHPEVRRRSAEIVANLPAGAIVVHEIPLLVENGLAPRFDVVVVVEAPLQARLARLRARGLSDVDAQARMAAQASDAERRDVAGQLLQNDGSYADLMTKADTLWDYLRGR